MKKEIRPTRARRVVVLRFNGKETQPEAFRTCPEMYLKYSTHTLGICLNALWNVMAKKGAYKNKICSIRYEDITSLKRKCWL